MEGKPTQVSGAEANPLAFPACSIDSTEVYHLIMPRTPGCPLSNVAAISSSS